MPDPLEELSGRPKADPLAELSGGNRAIQAPGADPLAELSGKVPPATSAGPLDPRPAMRAVGQVAGDIIPEPVKDVVGQIGGFFAKRLGAMGEVIANPLIRDVSPEAIRGMLLKYPFLDPSERAQIQSYGPSKDVPLFVGSGRPFDPIGALKRAGDLGRALTEGVTPEGEPASTMELLRDRGFTQPFGPSKEQAEAENRATLGLPVGSISRMLTTPEAASLGIESAGAPLMNAVGRLVTPLPIEAAKRALDFEARVPAGLRQAVAQKTGGRINLPAEVRTRAIPGIKEGLEFFGDEKSLPNRFRGQIEDILRTREGQADLRAFVREKSLGKYQKLPVEAQDRIATAIEKRAINTLQGEEQLVARKLEHEYLQEVFSRKNVRLRPFELGSHIEPMRQEAADKVLTAARAEREAARLQGNFKGLPKAQRKSLIGGMSAKRAERAYMKSGTAKAFDRMVAAKTAHAQALDELKGLKAGMGGYRKAQAQAALATRAARKSVKALSRETGVKVPTKTLMDMALGIRDPKRFEGVAFTKRVITKEKRLELKEKPYGAAITPHGLSTGKMNERVTDIFKTTEDLNQESVQAHGYRAFEPVVQATLKGAAANDTRVMNAGILIDAVRRFGRPARAGEKTLAEIYGAKSGFTKDVQKVLEKTSVDPELHDYLVRLNKSLTPEHYGKWVNAVRTVNDQFKKWALFSPGFISRNVQNNLIQTAIYGNTDLKNWTEAFHLRRKLARANSIQDLHKTFININGVNIPADYYIANAIKRGVVGRGQTAIETGKSFAEGRLNPFRAIRSANEFSEDVSRMSFDIHLQRQGYNPMASARKIDQVLFNYSPRFASGGFQKVRRYAIPFVNWTSQIVPLVARTALERPGSMGMIASGIEKANAAKGFKPEDMPKLGKDIQDQGGIVIGQGPDGVRIVKPTGYGSYDANSILAPLLNKDVRGMVDELASRGYPYVNVPYALLTGKDPLTGAELTGKPVPGPPALKLLFVHPQGKAWAEKHGIFMDKKDQAIVRVPDRVNIVLRSFPPTRLASLVADIIKPDKGTERRVKSFAAGVSEVTRNEAQQEFFKIRDTKEGLAEAMKLLRRYPPEARWQISQQFDPAVRRKLLARGIIKP